MTYQCMDNDDQRRSKPSLHKVYGESIALLASYALSFAGFEKIHANTQALHDPLCLPPHIATTSEC